MSTYESRVEASPDNSERRTSAAHVPFLLRFLQLGPVVVLLGLVIVLSILSDVFLTTRNIQNVGVQSSIVAVLAVGQLVVILTRGIDLSVGANIALSGVVGAIAFRDLGSPWVALVSMLAAGTMLGVVNGLLYVKAGITPPFVVTLATLFVGRGLALTLADGKSVSPVPGIVTEAGSGTWGPVPIPVVIVVAVAAAGAIVTRTTKWGRWIYAIGGDPEAAERVGIPVGRVTISVYAMCGFTAGVAGMITAGRTGGGYPTSGNLAELDSIAAVIIGGASMMGGRGFVLNAVVGALILGSIRNGLNILNVSPFWQQMAIGLIVLIGVRLDLGRQSLEGRLRTRSAIQVEDAQQ